MFKYLKQQIQFFYTNKKSYPILTLVAATLYALLYYYDKNYALINSGSQFLFLISLYVLLPIALFFTLNFLFQKVKGFNPYRKYLLPIFNIGFFLLSIVVSIYSFDLLKLLIAIVLGLIFGILFVNHIKKIVILQVLLICMVVPKLIPDVYREVTYSKQWMEQPDAIEEAVFKKRPNIYLIQPDGYASFSALKDSIHNFNNSAFEGFLKQKGFKTYDDFRSNYFSTLTSNSSLFAMKHHYYGNTTLGINPRHNRRNEIVESNPVLRTLKHNNYKTFLMLQVPYLLANRPSIDFDYCNISLDEISYIDRGFSGETNLMEETKAAIKNNRATSNFFFIESMLPSHITTHYNSQSSIENERKLYLDKIELANAWLSELISFIEKEDPNSLVIVAADHGGFVGLNSSLESEKRTENPLVINSIFSSLLAVKWPNNDAVAFDSNLKTSVNLFRVLFAYLSENEAYLQHLQENKSYIIIRNEAPTGVYEYIDQKGQPTFYKIK
jgi:hypothetical protein